jgi:hypothetical protein
MFIQCIVPLYFSSYIELIFYKFFPSFFIFIMNYA